MSGETRFLPLEMPGLGGKPGHGELSLGVTFTRPAPSADRHAAIYYLHGGGMLFGTRDDLPSTYVDAILERGFTLVALDYPLAPQASIGEILDVVERAYLAAREALAGSHAFLCGRSAGAYLCLMLARRLQLRGVPPAGVIDFYGYCNLAGEMRAALLQPSIFYRRSYALVTPRVARKLSGADLLCDAPLERRFGLYVYARQTGSWGSLLGRTADTLAGFSLDARAQGELPPLFIAASRDDCDVPFQNSARLAQNARSATTHFVESGGHDFDRDSARPEGPAAWRACLEWAEGLIL